MKSYREWLKENVDENLADDINAMFKESDREELDEARMRITCDIGKFIPMPGGKCAIMVNGKPEGNCWVEKKGDKRILCCDLWGKKIRIPATGKDGKMSRDDKDDFRLAVGGAFFDHQEEEFEKKKRK